MKLAELKAIAKENKIVGIMNKPEYIVSLKEKGLLLEESSRTVQTMTFNPVNDARYTYLKLTRQNPKPVIVEDMKTGKAVEYSSLYKAGRAIGVNFKRLLINADKIMDDIFKITIPDTKKSYVN